jgi:glycosyltransferase involved in cell wall biosynthesis
MLTYTHLLVENSLRQRLRVLLLIPHLGGGGAERVTALLAQNLSQAKYDLHLGVITQAGSGVKQMPPWVTIHALGASRVRAAALPLLRLIRRTRPDVILSGMAHLNFLVLLLRPLLPRKTCVLVRQNATISAALSFGSLPRQTRMLYRICYRHADRVICQTAAMASDLISELGSPEARIAVLPNPVDIEAIRNPCTDRSNEWTGPGPHLLAVGRLSREKGFDMLLDALALVRLRFPQTHLIIAGQGPEEPSLRSLCDFLSIKEAVHFAGYVEKPEIYFPGASVFALSSHHEGMPNALLEAAAGGLPIVALPSSGGVTDLLRDQPGVWMAKEISAPALSVALLSALEVLHSGQRFEHAFVEQFRVERAVRAYEEVIDSLPNERIL